ncbi:MAG: helix-turn-helix transcriptional regulator [Bacilli bacterium]|nr:helix-turn-helix transcriptional regulator [Bacilli bacterium]MBN2876819.1 helix-turn-helix transcriptional regulator [Bacilli bacterium]
MDSFKMGTFLIEMRKKKNLTQKNVADVCSVSTQAVSKWERGESVPDIQILEKLSLLYSISINEIIRGEKLEKRINKNIKKNIISLVFSVISLTAFLFNYIQVNELVFGGYYLLFHSVDGEINTMLWIIFLISVSYVILDIFKITNLLEPSKHMGLYYLLSGLLAYAMILIGLLSDVFLLYPQLILMICFGIILYLNVTLRNLAYKIPVVERYRYRMKSVRKYFGSKDDVKTSMEYQFKDSENKLYRGIKVLFLITFILYLVLLLLIVITIVSMLFSGEAHSHSEWDVILIFFAFLTLFNGLLFLTFKLRKTVLFGFANQVSGIIMLVALSLLALVYNGLGISVYLIIGLPSLLLTILGFYLDEHTALNK